MKVSRLLAITTVAAMLGSTAYATNGRDCTSLAAKVTDAMTKYSTAPNIEKAKVEQKKGEDFCGEGNYTRGVLHLKLALSILGVI